MRIVGGKHRSRTLFTPKDNAVRPTSDKVRQAVFNILNSRGLVVDAIVIDAFCGTGALGLEALSQGAKQCSFFDKDRHSIALTKQNIGALKEEDSCHVMLQDATKTKPKPDNIEPASLVFLDPPYNKELVTKAIESLSDKGWVSDEAYLVIETAKHEIISCPRINIMLEKTYGESKITLAELNLAQVN